ncbi:MAG: aminoacyl-tRNA hydrolase [Holosporales bacterium]|jgi:aminoacyl-tRNA hydrolase|nr:aminoacyl-tRNA hydrolase [Holosporales bacterium]
MFVDRLADLLGVNSWVNKFSGLVAAVDLRQSANFSRDCDSLKNLCIERDGTKGGADKNGTSKSGAIDRLILLKPQTFMNASGTSVSACMSYFKLAPDDLFVVHDDLDTQGAKLKLGGSPNGHNGLRDIHRAIGTCEYKRLRIGIGRPASKDMVKDYVLSNFSKAERNEIDAVIDNTIKCFDQFI